MVRRLHQSPDCCVTMVSTRADEDLHVDARNDSILRIRSWVQAILSPDRALMVGLMLALAVPLMRRIERVVEGSDHQQQVRNSSRDLIDQDVLVRKLIAAGKGVGYSRMAVNMARSWATNGTRGEIGGARGQEGLVAGEEFGEPTALSVAGSRSVLRHFEDGCCPSFN